MTTAQPVSVSGGEDSFRRVASNCCAVSSDRKRLWGLAEMVRLWTLWLAWSSLLAVPFAAPLAAQDDPQKLKVYLIGNSLTWDCVPAALGVDAQWHVDCGKNLNQIFTAPQKPCVPSSVVWTKALKENKYHVLCIQPHYGTSLSQDVERVGSWIAMQPSAVLVLHSGWAKHVDLEKEFLSKEVNSTDSSQSVAMLHSVSYMNELARLIKERDPRRIVRQTRVIDALHEIQLDIKRGAAPLKSVRELYRDDIHLTFTGGRYLAHNMLRQTLGLSPSSQGFQLDEELQSYLDKIITRFAEAP